MEIKNGVLVEVVESDIVGGVCVVPEGVTQIGKHAFRNCTSLTSVAIPDSVTQIGDYAFYGCISLTNVAIPDSVIEISDYAFCDCASLNTITGLKEDIIVGKNAFKNCPAFEWYYDDADFVTALKQKQLFAAYESLGLTPEEIEIKLDRVI